MTQQKAVPREFWLYKSVSDDEDTLTAIRVGSNCDDDYKNMIKVVEISALRDAQAQLKIAVEALEFYGTKTHFMKEIFYDKGAPFETYKALFSVRNDHGNIARNALAEIKQMSVSPGKGGE